MASSDIGTALVSLVMLLVVVAFVYRKLSPAKSIQRDPYNAQVNLHERYGKLEKRAVPIADMTNETLLLLERDGKLNYKTVESLRAQGRLPHADGQYRVAAPVAEVVAVEEEKVTQRKRTTKSKTRSKAR